MSPDASESLVPASPPFPPAPYIAPEEPTSTVTIVPVSNDPVLTAQLLILPTADPIVLLTCILTLLPDESFITLSL